MLTTSPRIPASTSASSPSSFHYAPCRSPQAVSTSRLSAPLTRRHSLKTSVQPTSPMAAPHAASSQHAAAEPSIAPSSDSARAETTLEIASSTTPERPQNDQNAEIRERDTIPPKHNTCLKPSHSQLGQQTVDQNHGSVRDPGTQEQLDHTTEQLDHTTEQPASITRQQQPSAPVVPSIVETKSTPPSHGTASSQGPTWVSPGKRRKSQDTSSNSPQMSGSEKSTSASSQASKRQRPAPPPQKVLPQKYEFCSWEDVVVLISHMLSELIETNDALALRSGNLTRFHSRSAPGIGVLDYLTRLAKHATLTPPLLLSMVYYIDRLCALYPEFTINTLTVHRFLITAATVASKGLSDSFWNNTTYARVGGVRVAELKLLELEFLYRVDWKIVPDPDVLVAYYRGLVERCPGYVLQGEEETSQDVAEDMDDAEEEAEEDAEGSTDISDGDEESEEVAGGSPSANSSSMATSIKDSDDT